MLALSNTIELVKQINAASVNRLFQQAVSTARCVVDRELEPLNAIVTI